MHAWQLLYLIKQNVFCQCNTPHHSSSKINLSQTMKIVLNFVYLHNQAHTCKTLGVVTKPMSIASTHAQMPPRNIIHARARIARNINFILAIMPSTFLGAGRGREYEYELACMSREAPRLLASEPVSFRQQQLTRSFSLSEGAINLPLYTKTICWCSQLPHRWPRIAVKGIYSHNFRLMRF